MSQPTGCRPARGAPGLPRRHGAFIPLLSAVTAALLAWSVPAQNSDQVMELEVPDLTVTAEDPLILLPPLGPVVDDSSIPLPPPAAARALPRATPVATSAGSGAAPPPAAVLQAARAPEAVARTSDLTGRAVLDDLANPRAVHTAVLLATGAPGRQAALALAATAPLQGAGPVRVSAHGRLSARGRQVGLELTLATAATDHVLQGRLTAAGPVDTALTYARWGSGSSASLAARFGLGRLLPALEVAIGGAVTLEAGGLFPLPAGRVTFAPAAEWRLEAELRPYVGFPRWLADAGGSAADDLELAPERAWLAWLGGGYGGLHLRIGLAHGRMHELDGDTVRQVPEGKVPVQLALEWDTVVHRGRAGDLTLRVLAGATGTWPPPVAVRVRLLLDAQWPILATPPVAVLLQGGWLQAPLYGVEDWLAGAPAHLGLSAAAGVRWAPAHGHRAQLLGGVRGEPGDLTLFIGIEYARSVVRLVAPPATAAR